MIEHILVPAIIILGLILVNGLFVTAEFAILAAPRTRMERLASLNGGLAAVVHRTQADQRLQDLYIATAQLGITVASLALGMYGEHTIALWLRPALLQLGWLGGPAAYTTAAIAAVFVLTYFHIVLGEMVPKSIALANPERAALAMGGPMLWCRRLSYPLVAGLTGAGSGILHLFHVPMLADTSHLHSPEELEMIVEESQETGLLGEEESDIFVNLLHFSGVQVRKVMVPRVRVVGISLDMPFSEVVLLVTQTHHTRYPVYHESLDHIRGILHVKELFKELRQHPDDPRLRRALRPAVFVPEQMTLEDLLVTFRRNGSQVAVAIDEYGGTAGIVSLEDVLEEIFGEVQDEFDAEEPSVQKIDDHTLRALGDVRLDQLAEEYDVDLQRLDVDTVGGLVLAELGRPARVGDSVRIGGVVLSVTSLAGLGVARVEITTPESDSEPPSNGNS